ncbi:MAG: hypothetical protein ACPGCR_02915, partial [Acholeplasmataceae bacterium]
FTNKDNKNIFSKLSLFNGEKIEKFSFKSKKEIHLQSYIYYELVDTYQKPVETTSNDTSTSQETNVKDITIDIMKNETPETVASLETEKHEVKKVSQNKKIKKNDANKEIPKKTERIQRLTLFDDDDI